MSEMTQANPSRGRWNYGREIGENFAETGDFYWGTLLNTMNRTLIVRLRNWGSVAGRVKKISSIQDPQTDADFQSAACTMGY